MGDNSGDKEFDEKSQILSRIYTSPNSIGGYAGVKKLLNEARKININISKQDVERYLRNSKTYTLHLRRKNKFPRRKVLAPKPRVIFSCDLADLSLLKKYNLNHTFLLICTDLFSRFMQVRPLKSKSADQVLKALSDILESPNSLGVSRLFTDKGTEFYNKKVLNYLKSRSIKLYSVESDVKASTVERAIQTLKNKMYRYMTEKNTYKYLPIIQQLVHSYNITPHLGLSGGKENQSKKYTPQIVHSLRDPKKIIKQFHKMNKTRSRIGKHFSKNLSIGQIVRLVLNKRTKVFRHGYLHQNTEELFKIIAKDSLHNNIPVYFLSDLNNKPIKGSFYAEELIPTELQDTYAVDILSTRIKKIGRKRIKQYRVSFRGYGPEFESWVDEKDLFKI